MASVIVMPKYGMTMKQGTLARWLVEEGSPVQAGTPIAEIETDKVTNELESPASGTLLKIIVPVGAEAAVGTAIAVMGEPGEDIGALLAEYAASPGNDSSGQATPDGKAPPADVQWIGTAAPAAEPGARVMASPAARKLATELAVDLAGVAGSGAAGRITREDVTAAASAASAPASDVFATPTAKKLAAELGVDLAGVAGSDQSGRIKREDVAAAAPPRAAVAAVEAPADPRGPAKERPYSGLRRTIGERMHASLSTAAPVRYHGLADVQELRQLLAQVEKQMGRLNANVDGDVLTTAAIVKAVALTLERMPRFNSSLEGDVIKIWKNIGIGVAVALSKGLIVPVVKDANRKSLSQIAVEIRDLAERAHGNELLADEISGGTFTVSTLGPYRSVDFFSPVINQPESAILGIGRMKDAVVAVDGLPVVRSTMGLSLTCDHRVLDGAPSAEFLEMIMDFLAEPLSLLV